MALDETASVACPRAWRWRLLTAGVILLVAGLRVVHLAYFSPLDLAPDEAHYWDWSRQLDWSYYSKGPLVAWLIRLSCALTGDWSIHLTGSEALAVRLPAVVCGSLLLVSLYVLTSLVYRREGLAFAVVALALTTPVVAVGSTLMTIDAPYVCCWSWALVTAYCAIFRRAAWAWPVTGLLIGLGILAKYTMLFWVPSLGLFLLATPAYRPLLWRPGPWVMLGVAVLCCVPILVWNVQHDWISLRHVAWQARVNEEGAGVQWLGPLSFLAVQLALLLGFWLIVWLRAMLAHAPWKETQPELSFLWWTSALTFLFFFLWGFKTGSAGPNWPATAYLSGLVLAAGWLERQLRTVGVWHRRIIEVGGAAACGVGVGAQLLLCGFPWMQSVLAELAGPPTEARPIPLRTIDPTCRLRGWHALAAEIDRVRDRLEQNGETPVLAGSTWTTPGELAFYCHGQPTVYSLGAAIRDRHSQYDVWRPNPVADLAQFAGRTFILVGEIDPEVLDAFTCMEPTHVMTYEENGEPIARWHITVCRGYKGFPDAAAAQSTRY
jgi:4-amino-4-deoxy-L-arabinose transferase-like glycosyltransferase